MSAVEKREGVHAERGKSGEAAKHAHHGECAEFEGHMHTPGGNDPRQQAGGETPHDIDDEHTDGKWIRSIACVCRRVDTVPRHCAERAAKADEQPRHGAIVVWGAGLGAL